jgi:5-methylcytosine-specific restriction endonuclease McrA
VRERQRGLCARCDNRIAEWDHIIPLDLGGANAEANLMGLCTRHHKLKTARDMKAIAKARRIRKREAGETKAKRPIASRPLTHPTLKRGFDNKVVPR